MESKFSLCTYIYIYDHPFFKKKKQLHMKMQFCMFGTLNMMRSADFWHVSSLLAPTHIHTCSAAACLPPNHSRGSLHFSNPQWSTGIRRQHILPYLGAESCSEEIRTKENPRSLKLQFGETDHRPPDTWNGRKKKNKIWEWKVSKGLPGRDF